MAQIVRWDSTNTEKDAYSLENKNIRKYVYKIDSLPDFSTTRYGYLGKEVDSRYSEILKKHLRMIRGFYSLGHEWGISLRFLKRDDSKEDNPRISVYLILRHNMDDRADDTNYDVLFRSFLPTSEYYFELVQSDETEDVEWAKEACEIFKTEAVVKGRTYKNFNVESQKFYVPFLWKAVEKNDLKKVCETLAIHQGRIVIDFTIVPTQIVDVELEWINENLRQIREAYNGGTLQDESGKVLKAAGESIHIAEIPSLKAPLDNFEQMLKSYPDRQVFMFSLRIFSETDVKSIGKAFLNSAVERNGHMFVYRTGFPLFEHLKESYKNNDISVKSGYLIRPMIAQRMIRLVSIEEVLCFFRFPIPTENYFPGFYLDTGLRCSYSKKKENENINLGVYLDEIKERSAFVNLQDFAKHGLIVGVPGSGKTTTMFSLLYQFWNKTEEKRVPFMVLEPAKTEYRALKTLKVFENDLLVFTLGDESISPFRFNIMEVPRGIKLENHISRLYACFIGALNPPMPVPLILEKAIRKTYSERGWYEDSVGGEEGLEMPTISDLYRNARKIASLSGYKGELESNIEASLLERLDSLRRGSKGKMLDTRCSVSLEELMQKPVVLELDSLNGEEKSLIMMILLNFVYEYCKVNRKSGNKLAHVLVVEEAHNLIGAQHTTGESYSGSQEKVIELFVSMLAEMRALGQGILIADQLPTAIAPQAVKQTNIKVLMRETSKDDREIIGNTMDLDENQMHMVVDFKAGHAFVYHEGENKVRLIRMINFKKNYSIEETITDAQLQGLMKLYEESHQEVYKPFKQCSQICSQCNRRVRSQAQNQVEELIEKKKEEYTKNNGPLRSEVIRQNKIQEIVEKDLPEAISQMDIPEDTEEIELRGCVYVHSLNLPTNRFDQDIDIEKIREGYLSYLSKKNKEG